MSAVCFVRCSYVLKRLASAKKVDKFLPNGANFAIAKFSSMAGKDLFLLDTNCQLNAAVQQAFESKGYAVKLATDFEGVPNEVLKQAAGYWAVGLFVNRKITENQLEILSKNGNKILLCCSSGYDNLPPPEKIAQYGIRIGRVPSYSPSSIAEYAVSTILALAKNVQKSYEQTSQADFRIGGLQCLLLEDKTVGVIGTGEIGKKAVAKLSGLFRQVLCYDTFPDKMWIRSFPNADYVPKDKLITDSNVITIHVPLLPDTRHLINKEAINKMKKNVVIVNTSRGEIIHTDDLLDGLKSGKVFGAGLDVFEGEKAFMFKDMSVKGFKNHPDIEELAKMHNVIISSHIGFYTDHSIKQISQKTLENYMGFINDGKLDEKAVVI